MGNLLLVSRINNRARRIDVNGIITTIAGNGRETFNGDDSLAVSASAFSASGAKVIVNRQDRSSLIVSRSDTFIDLKDSKKELNLKLSNK